MIKVKDNFGRKNETFLHICTTIMHGWTCTMQLRYSSKKLAAIASAGECSLVAYYAARRPNILYFPRKKLWMTLDDRLLLYSRRR